MHSSLTDKTIIGGKMPLPNSECSRHTQDAPESLVPPPAITPGLAALTRSNNLFSKTGHENVLEAAGYSMTRFVLP